MPTVRNHRRAAAALLALSVAVAACGGDDDTADPVATIDSRPDSTATAPPGTDAEPTTEPSTESSTGVVATAAPTTAAAAECPGEPIPVTMIVSMSGPLAVSADDVNNGLTAATTAINSSCQLGRPLEVKVCDDQSNPNESLACGRAAAEESIVLLDSLSTMQEGPAAAGLPVVLSLGSTTFDLTDPNSYPAGAGPVVIMGEIAAVSALGAENAVFLAPDIAYAQVAFGVAGGVASARGLSLDSVFYPADTSDFAPVIAQVAEKDPDAIVMLTSNPVPIYNALDAAGISLAETPVITLAAVVSPEMVAELGDRVEGAYLLTQVAPPTEVDNPGIVQMGEEYEAAGLDFADPNLSTYAAIVWSNIHILADALAGLDEARLAELDGAGVVEALVAASPIEHPARAGIDYTTPAFADGPLAAFRIFSHEAMVLRIEDGQFRALTGFEDVVAGFELPE